MADAELKNYEDFVMDTSSTKKRAIKVAFKARRTCIRKATLVICALFLVIGICMIIFGATIQKSDSQELVKNQLAVAIIVIGVFVLLIGCIGIVGALMDHKGVVLVYQALLGIFFFVQIIIASLTLADSSNADSIVQTAWNNADAGTRISVQNDFGCCGLYGNNTNIGEDCPVGTFGRACSDAVVSDLKSKYWPAGFICIIQILLQIAGLIFGCWMVCGKKEAAASDLQSKRKRKEAELTTVTTEQPGEKKKKGKKKKEKTGELR